MKVSLIQSWLFNFFTVCSPNMDNVLVFSLILGLISNGQSQSEVTGQTHDSCYKRCPAGYHKVQGPPCNDPTAIYRCKKCGDKTFTEIENTEERCQRCRSCETGEKIKENCTFNKNTVCGCEDGYFKSESEKICKKCDSCKDTDNTECKTKCQLCKRTDCLKKPECKGQCGAITTTPAKDPSSSPSPSPSPSPTTPTTTSTTVFTTTVVKETPAPAPAPTSAPTPASRATVLNSTSNPVIHPVPHNSDNQMLWLFLVVAVTFVMLFWFLLLFTRNLLRNTDSCSCWSTNKDLPVEDPKCYEPHSHQDSSSATLTFNVCEKTPVMTFRKSPAIPEHLPPTSRLLPDSDHTAATQEEQPDHWPAIVLYAIIKAVPLRRWKEFLRLLSVADQQLERVELEAGLGQSFLERQYQMLRLWSQQSSASLGDVFSALCNMELPGCAQLLQENLDKLQWRSESKQSAQTCRSPTVV